MIIGIIIIILIILILMWGWDNYNKSYRKKYEDAIKTLYRQSARWGVASLQDDSELIRNLHANYATGYLWALKDIISSEEFKRITGEDFQKIEEKVVSIQDTAAKMLVDKCKPLIYVKDPVLLSAIYSKA
jgi:uncharacterized membrane protein (DUF106 family)